MTIPWLALLLVSSSGLAYGQLAAVPGVQSYVNSQVSLRMGYSTAFDREAAARLANIPGALLSVKPGTEECASMLLTLGSGLDRAEQIVVKGKDPQMQAKGTLVVGEIKRSCFEPATLDDDILRQAVAETAKMDGMRPLSRPGNDLVLGITVWFAASTGFNKDAKGKRVATAGTTILGTAGAVVNGHLLVWRVTANDPALFNRLLGVSVCFDVECEKGSAQLVGFRLAEGREVASR